MAESGVFPRCSVHRPCIGSSDVSAGHRGSKYAPEEIRGKTGPAPSGALLFGPFSYAHKKKDKEERKLVWEVKCLFSRKVIPSTSCPLTDDLSKPLAQTAMGRPQASISPPDSCSPSRSTSRFTQPDAICRRPIRKRYRHFLRLSSSLSRF